MVSALEVGRARGSAASAGLRVGTEWLQNDREIIARDCGGSPVSMSPSGAPDGERGLQIGRRKPTLRLGWARAHDGNGLARSDVASDELAAASLVMPARRPRRDRPRRLGGLRRAQERVVGTGGESGARIERELGKRGRPERPAVTVGFASRGILLCLHSGSGPATGSAGVRRRSRRGRGPSREDEGRVRQRRLGARRGLR